MRTRVALVLGGAVVASLALGGGVAQADDGTQPAITHAFAAGKAVTVALGQTAAGPNSAKPVAGGTVCILLIPASEAPGEAKPASVKAVTGVPAAAKPAPVRVVPGKVVLLKPGKAVLLKPGKVVLLKPGKGTATACYAKAAPTK
jgi:hypothetical protein